MQGICAPLTGENLCWIALCYANIFGIAVFNASMLHWTGGLGRWSICLLYMHCPRSSSGCSGMQGICAQLTGVGGPLPSIYMHCPRSSSGSGSMQGICARLTGEDLCWIALCYANIFGLVVFNASMLDWGVQLTSIYMHCPRSSSGCSRMQGISAWLTGG